VNFLDAVGADNLTEDRLGWIPKLGNG